MGYERNDRRYGVSGDRYGSGGYGDRGRYYGTQDYGRSDYGRDDNGNRGDYGSRSPYGGYGRDRDDRGNRFNDRPEGYDYQDRGFFDRAGDEVRSWFGDEEAERRRRYDERYDRRYGNGEYRSDYYTGAAGAGVNDYYGGSAYGSGYGDYSRTDYGRASQGRGQARWDPSSERTRTSAHDSSYHSWRDREVAALDRDYDEYRRENQSRFDNEFGTWRQTRQGQRGLLTKVQEHQEVVGSDGQHIGTVDHVRGDRIQLTKSDKDAGGHHHSIPSAWITAVDDKVTVAKTADQAKQHWRDEERNEGGLFGSRDRDTGTTNLNRSFSGTY